VYGLEPHQQPADIYFGPGYEGRGGWSWYTGAAGRMLFNALALLRMEKMGGSPATAQDSDAVR
jgi:cyclic beta-1,2-glucan synthetase